MFRAMFLIVALAFIGPQSAPAPVVTPDGGCCKVCHKGKACGDSCIAQDRECRQPPGCACDG